MFKAPRRQIGGLLLAGALGLGLSCDRRGHEAQRVPADAPPAADTLPAAATPTAQPAPPHLADVRFLFEERCSLCHLPEATDEQAPAAALAVFDLNDASFTDGLSDAQLVEGRRRLFEDNLPDADQALVDQWLRAEWRWRDGHPQRYPPGLRSRAPMDPVVTPAEGCVGAACLPVR